MNHQTDPGGGAAGIIKLEMNMSHHLPGEGTHHLN
jgi:hypothetical protein